MVNALNEVMAQVEHGKPRKTRHRNHEYPPKVLPSILGEPVSPISVVYLLDLCVIACA